MSSISNSVCPIPDSIAPFIQTGKILNRTKLKVVFSEKVDESSATNIANYNLNHEIEILSACFSADSRSLFLTTEPHIVGTCYTLTVMNVKDQAIPPNTIAYDTKGQYTFVEYPSPIEEVF